MAADRIRKTVFNAYKEIPAGGVGNGDGGALRDLQRGGKPNQIIAGLGVAERSGGALAAAAYGEAERVAVVPNLDADGLDLLTTVNLEALCDGGTGEGLVAVVGIKGDIYGVQKIIVAVCVAVVIA